MVHNVDVSKTFKNRSKSLQDALRAYFTDIGCMALIGVATGRISHPRASSVVMMLRALMLEDPDSHRIRKWINKHKLLRGTDVSYFDHLKADLDQDDAIRI